MWRSPGPRGEPLGALGPGGRRKEPIAVARAHPAVPLSETEGPEVPFQGEGPRIETPPSKHVAWGVGEPFKKT